VPGAVSMTRDVLADQPANQHADFANDEVQIEHLRPEHLLAAEGEELTGQ
jgi:hypothetical protein